MVRYRTQYTTIFKYCKKQYRSDKALVKGYYKGTGEVNDQMIIQTLQLISDLKENKEWFKEKENLLNNAFGKKYLSEYTDWESIRLARENFSKIGDLIGNLIQNDTVRHLLCSSDYPVELKELHKQISEYLSSAQWRDIEDIVSMLIIKNREIAYIPSALTRIKGLLVEIETKIKEIEPFSKGALKYNVLVHDVQQKSRLDDIEENLNRNYQDLKNVFSDLYTGSETDWDQITDALVWTEKITGFRSRFEISDDFFNNFQTGSYCDNLLELLVEHKDALSEKWSWFKSLFDTERGMLDANTDEVVDILDNCLSGFSLLEEWIDYRKHRQICEKMGLGEYIQKAEEADMLKNHLTSGYLRRFYNLWLDIYMAKYPSIMNFRKKTHMDRIENFRELDKKSLEIARARIRSKLIHSLPNRNFTCSAGDEVSILNREMSKRRRIMPLRKLFASIPNLLMTLKPCMMMSPLSVSLFLQAETYDFDTVIFDEASQVKTEDAVGAIMRGKTVIICGDAKQLPPTSFFGTSKMDDDYDSEEEELDDYESILDEALTVLPNRTLKWHYRSKHEHLIAFSNAKIYNNELITFPSCKDDVPDEGVEYIFVKNGVYDRGGSRSNVIEAKRVAKIVTDHFTCHPKRSLGVVTFSAAQRDAIETELRSFRLKDKSYEEFFNEDVGEPFFVKSLETVQGDERDTIIFSIGYAKDGTGKPMAMNFGPLTKNGGERRLNVAITRAKHNVKLVGSIYPTDIDLDRTSSEGAKLLRSYIEFAKEGPKVLLRETTVNTETEFDSPFEISIYDFLTLKGHKVDTQVGCSGYKIDLAVKHPSLSGVYVMGIECDGATYHSTRTARERDRIRQTVLEDMGWKIYRIWSTDYIKDPRTEHKKLLESIEECIKEFSLEQDITQYPLPAFSVDEHNNHLLEVEEAVSEDVNQDIEKYGFKYYEAADIYELGYYLNDAEAFSNVISKVVDIESPIHFELLCRRIAPLTGREKVTKIVRDIVNASMPYCMDVLDQRHDFIWKKNENIPSVRIAETSNLTRVIEHIPPEEIAEAMMTITMSSYGIKKEGLFGETRRIFGFSRSGQKIIKVLEDVFYRLISDGRIQVLDEKISLV